MLPLYEAKMIHQFDSRWATYDENGIRLMTPEEKNQHRPPLPRYWVADEKVDLAWGERRPISPYFAWRGIARTSDARTAIGTVMPPPVPGGGNFDMVLGIARERLGLFSAAFSSFAFDYAVRQKMSNMHLQFTVAKQLPMPEPRAVDSWSHSLGRLGHSWVALRVELLDGWVPDSTERLHLRAELDALMFHLYGVSREDVSYVLDTFPIVKRKDEATFGSFRTKEFILAAYDALAVAKESGMEYQAPWDREVVSS